MFRIIREKRVLYSILRILYPVGLHFGVQQIIILAFFFLERLISGERDSFLTDPLFMTGAAAAVVIIPAVMLYRSDRQSRLDDGRIIDSGKTVLNPAEVLLLLAGGAALSMAGNLLLSVIGQFFSPEGFPDVTGRIMQNKSFFVLVLMAGILAPAAEEMIFRWLVFLRIRDLGLGCAVSALLSGILFGVYHGNPGQAVYASVLGFFFAWFLEMSGNLWSCVLLHIGANVWSVFLLKAGELMPDTDAYVRFFMKSLLILILFFAVAVFWAVRQRKKRGYRAV